MTNLINVVFSQTLSIQILFKISIWLTSSIVQIKLFVENVLLERNLKIKHKNERVILLSIL